jgi:hypothetical protein
MKKGNNFTQKRSTLFCTYCRNKGHNISECQKKKRDEGEKGKQNTVKGLACMARELKKNDPYLNIMYGFCMVCNDVGLVNISCTACGEGSGNMYIATKNTNQESDSLSQDSIDSDGNEVIYRETDYIQDSKMPAINKNIKLQDIDDVEEPTYLKEWDPKYADPKWDVFQTIPIEDLFDKMHEHLNTTESKRNYILRNHGTMEKLKYMTIPTIIQNYDNINFNIQLHNEYYLPKINVEQRPNTIPCLQILKLAYLLNGEYT